MQKYLIIFKSGAKQLIKCEPEKLPQAFTSLSPSKLTSEKELTGKLLFMMGDVAAIIPESNLIEN